MRPGAPHHTKMRRLERRFGCDVRAICTMELLFHFCADEAIDGDLTKYESEDIASKVRWKEDAEVLITHLVETGWLDKTPDGKLLMHDWSQHAPDFVHAKLARAGRFFGDGTMPRMDKLSQKERERARRLFDDQAPVSGKSAVDQAPVSGKSAVDQAPVSGKSGPSTLPSLPLPSSPFPSGVGVGGTGKGECERETSQPPAQSRKSTKRQSKEGFVHIGQVASSVGAGLVASDDGVPNGEDQAGSNAIDPKALEQAEALALLIEKHPNARTQKDHMQKRRKAIAVRIMTDGLSFVSDTIGYVMAGADVRCDKIAKDLALYHDACLPGDTGNDRLARAMRWIESKHGKAVRGLNGGSHPAPVGVR